MQPRPYRCALWHNQAAEVSDIVVFSVTGSGAPSIQYGNGATTNNPNDGAGPLGDGNYLPWHASMTYSPGALYYAVTAQNEGSGSISDTVTEQVTTVCSNGTHTESFPLANGNLELTGSWAAPDGDVVLDLESSSGACLMHRVSLAYEQLRASRRCPR